jgi:hypothetical protein
MFGEFGAVAAAEFGKAVRLMAVPFAQSGRRRERALPSIDFQFCFSEPARPQPIDENADAILRARRIISALDRDG